MQNQTLPIQLSPNFAAPAPSRTNVQANSDGAAFSQSLNREMAQRQAAAVADKPAPAPAPAPAASKPTPAAPPPKQPAAQPATGPVRAAQHLANVDNAEATANAADDAATTDDAAAGAIIKVDPETAAAAAAAATAASAAAAADGAAAAAPMADMLTMLASYQKLLHGGAPADTATASATAADTTLDAKTGVPGTGLAADTQTLAALQNALKNGAATDQADAATQAADDNGKPGVKGRAPVDLGAAASRATAQPETALAGLREASTSATSAALKDSAPVSGSAFQAQLSSAEMVQTAVTPGSDRIPARLGTTAWDNQVSQKVVWMVGGMDQTASLTLNPPDLGPVQVVLNVNNDQATVAFSAATPEVREALENALPRLREMMSEAGVKLGEASVGANLPDQRQADSGQGNQERRAGADASGQGSGVRRGETEIPIPRSASRVVRADGAVDTFA